VNVAVCSRAVTESEQGVRQVWPVVVLTSAPGGSDSNSTVAAGGGDWNIGKSKLGKEKPEQAARERLDAIMTRARRMVISVNSCGRRPHPLVTLQATRERVQPTRTGLNILPAAAVPAA
jgi:N-acetylmuramic acid 6-phosphate (MurNAc-6-P) etherase